MKLGDIFDELRNTEIDAPNLLKKRVLDRLREERRYNRILLFWKCWAILSTLLFVASILYFMSAHPSGRNLQPAPQERKERPMQVQTQGQRPKPSFVTACGSSNVNDPCSYTTREGSTVKGKCILSDIPTGGKELACSVDGKTVQAPPPPTPQM